MCHCPWSLNQIRFHYVKALRWLNSHLELMSSPLNGPGLRIRNGRGAGILNSHHTSLLFHLYQLLGFPFQNVCPRFFFSCDGLSASSLQIQQIFCLVATGLPMWPPSYPPTSGEWCYKYRGGCAQRKNLRRSVRYIHLRIAISNPITFARNPTVLASLV